MFGSQKPPTRGIAISGQRKTHHIGDVTIREVEEQQLGSVPALFFY